MSTEAGDIATNEGGSVDTLQKTIKSQEDFHKYWMGAIQLASDTEKDWREDAKVAIRQFRSEVTNQYDHRTAKFNILYANMQTICPAIYNSFAEPDIRPRFEEAQGEDPQAVQVNQDRKNVSSAIERAISLQADMYDYDAAMQAATQDRELPGRAITRVRVNLVEGAPKTDQETGNEIPGSVVAKHITWEHVCWDDFRIGPAKQWADTPWIAFGWPYTRAELEGLNPELAWKVDLDMTVQGASDQATPTPDMFKRAMVWEIWDRTARKVYWLAESYDKGPLKVEDDPYKLRGFFPIPKPMLAISTTDSQIPICPFTVWKAQQEEMNSLTRRIGALIQVIRWRGVYDGAFEQAVNAMKNLDDGDLAPAPDAARALVKGDIESAFWIMPIEKAVEVLKQLYESRELCKQVIYELTGVADILRGATKANETLGAQKLKAEWGSLRLQNSQRAIQMHIRDLMRLTADLMGEHFTERDIALMTGIQLTPQQWGLFKTDLAREFSIDIETDGTIKADLSRAQENVAGFVQGFGGFIESVGPAVQAGLMTPVEAVGLLRTFARNFKLGRQADHILDQWQARLEMLAKQPPRPPPPDPKLEAEKIKAEAEMAKTQMQGQIDAADHQMTMQERQAEFSMKMATLKAEFEKFQAEHAMDMQQRQVDAAIRVGEHQLQAEEQRRAREMGAEQHGQKLEVMDAQTQAKIAAAKMKPKPGNGAAK